MNKIPNKAKLKNLYNKLTDAEIGLIYNVSDATIRRWRRVYKILSKPPGPRLSEKRKFQTSDKKVATAVSKSYSVSEVLRKLKVCKSGSSHVTMKERIKELNLDISHFGVKRNSVLGFTGSKIPLDKILIKNSTYRSPSRLRKRLISEKILKEKCASCGLGPIWQNKPLTLQLDHIDGDKHNCLITNLRLNCPNCHTQTPTFCGKNIKKDH